MPDVGARGGSLLLTAKRQPLYSRSVYSASVQKLASRDAASPILIPRGSAAGASMTQ